MLVRDAESINHSLNRSIKVGARERGAAAYGAAVPLEAVARQRRGADLELLKVHGLDEAEARTLSYARCAASVPASARAPRSRSPSRQSLGAHLGREGRVREALGEDCRGRDRLLDQAAAQLQLGALLLSVQRHPPRLALLGRDARHLQQEQQQQQQQEEQEQGGGEASARRRSRYDVQVLGSCGGCVPRT